MLKSIDTDFWLAQGFQDPVRPEVPLSFRFAPDYCSVYGLERDGQICSIICCARCIQAPESLEQLYQYVHVTGHWAVFYSIWSLRPGSGRQLIKEVQESISQSCSWIQHYVTLSPKTKMAENFHISNGASVFRTNAQTINYLYP